MQLLRGMVFETVDNDSYKITIILNSVVTDRKHYQTLKVQKLFKLSLKVEPTSCAYISLHKFE